MPSSWLSGQQGRAGRSPANSFLTSAANEMADYLQEGYYPPPLPLESNAPPGRSSRHISSPLTMFVMPEMRMIEAVRAALTEEMERDERVLVMGEDVGRKGGVFGATDGLFARFGESRVLDTPLAESAIVGGAVGAGPGPGALPRAQEGVPPRRRGGAGWRPPGADRTRHREAGGSEHQLLRVGPDDPLLPAGGRAARRRRHQRRGRRPADPRAARPGDHPRLGAQDRQSAGRARGQPDGRVWRRGRRDHLRARLRRPRRPRDSGRRAGHARHAFQWAAGGVLHAQPGEDRGGDEKACRLLRGGVAPLSRGCGQYPPSAGPSTTSGGRAWPRASRPPASPPCACSTRPAAPTSPPCTTLRPAGPSPWARV